MCFESVTISFAPRYCLSCQKTLYYPLYKVSTVKRNHNDDKSDDVPPEAFLMIDNLMFEVFRNSEGSETDLMSKFFSKRKWECEFHKIYSWAPVRQFKNRGKKNGSLLFSVCSGRLHGVLTVRDGVLFLLQILPGLQ